MQKAVSPQQFRDAYLLAEFAEAMVADKPEKEAAGGAPDMDF